ncbi:hypothetical protein SDC9_193465 [bioreactor metagenome]|uniref:Uncharacterized protein n=1 Tax=bioreactor metagenome TaxID=1076179 RepID=A0A645I4T6_9ZZZZ
MNNINGIIVDNDDDALYSVILQICKNPDMIKALKENVCKFAYDNLAEMEKVEKLIDGDL